MNIAIDGPAGAGKSTIAKLLAGELNILYLDTGAMYRAAALRVLRAGGDCQNPADAERIAGGADIAVRYEGGAQRVYLDGADVTAAIREPHISKAASDVSAHPAVRYKMVELQREIAKNTDMILDGRDIGTFVLPHAAYKFFLTADADERARRRYDEQKAKGMRVDLNLVKAEILARDANDSGRALAPLKKAADAVEIDTTALSIAEVVQKLLSYIR
ncbi:MAG: (d)CMP kinase [Clostridiales bacterium]|jgi:cytidylate kinase|nr:(d)CMP kinase [Clostridiales bacterium]